MRTNREFKVDDVVFCTMSGIGRVVSIRPCREYSVEVVFDPDIWTSSYTCIGVYSHYSGKYPSLFHIDEALKLFPMWLEEVETEDTEIRIGAYNPTDGLMDELTFSVVSKGKIIHSDDQILVEIHIPTKRKIIREKQA